LVEVGEPGGQPGVMVVAENGGQSLDEVVDVFAGLEVVDDLRWPRAGSCWPCPRSTRRRSEHDELRTWSPPSDCDGAENRNKSNSRDRRCSSGFVCGVASVTGTFCCKKLCMCKDFLVIPSSGLETPAVCNKQLNPGACPLVK
jgi:hypothetical protein